MSFLQNSAESTRYSQADNLTWSKLIDGYGWRLDKHGCKEFVVGFERLRFSRTCVEDTADLSARLHEACGWRVQSVDGLLPNRQFFGLLTDKVFPVSVQMRSPDVLAFSELPDRFHDALGHLPLLVHPAYSEFLVQYAAVSVRHLDSPDALNRLARLYWYILETGLVMEDGHEKLIGAAIATSSAEYENATSPSTHRIPFNFQTVFSMDYDIFKLQPCYFVIESFSALRGIAAGLEGALHECLGKV